MKLKFTPGPWLREDRLIYSLQSAGFKKGKEQFENRFGAVFLPGKTCPIEEVEANARLAQAAPEMYELLKQAREIVDPYMNKWREDYEKLMQKIEGEPEAE